MHDSISLIWGGSDGLGLEIAYQRMRAGDKTIIVGRNAEKINSLQSSHKGLVGLLADLQDANAINYVINQVMQRFGRVDNSIYSAGLWQKGLVGSYSFATIEKLMAVNAIAPIYVTQLLVPIMKNQNHGKLIYIVSKDANYAKADRSIYHASKWALKGFIECIQHDLKNEPINVLGVYPGVMNTKLFQKSGQERTMEKALDPAWVAQVISQAIDSGNKGNINRIDIE